MKEDEKQGILQKISSPNDLKNIKDLNKLCSEIREKIVSIVSKNGGHLASNLGVVELSVALYKVFSGPSDKIIWDVGHQCYAHKMLTGRLGKIDTIRTEGGVSGFPNKSESDYDVFTTGHSSTSISSALGLAYSNEINNKNAYTVAVIGDGALTGGLAYEGLNNAGKFKKNFIVILNDNKMSISRNVGAISRYLTYIRIRPSYAKIKGKMELFLNNVPIFGQAMLYILKKIKSIFKGLLYDKTLFEDMGFLYYGPIDGHDLNKLIEVFKRIKELNRPVFVHIVTTKGKGYRFAEKNPKQFHGVSGFNAETGDRDSAKESFSGVFGEELCRIAKENEKVCAITAAMKAGTGLSDFSKSYKNRFFDAGIAEEHAVTFAGGLAAGGMIPVVAIYSSFLQRAYDQIIHDVAVQGTKVIFAVDRAGFTGNDGENHQGLFDCAFLNSVPGMRILAPAFFDELKCMLKVAVFNYDKFSAIRYPKGSEFYKPEYFKYSGADFDVIGNKESDVLVITYGRIFSNVCLAYEEILNETHKEICILKLNVIKPININAIAMGVQYKYVFMFEEACKSGGIGESFGEKLLERGFKGKFFHIGVDDKFIACAEVESQIKKFRLDSSGIKEKILNACNSCGD